jgi:hypothetical protein
MSEEKKRALVGNAADEEQVKEAKGKEKRREEREQDDMIAVTSIPQGRRLLWRLLSECGVFRSSMTGDNYTYFNEGRRDVGVRLLSEITQANPEAYLQMMKESQDA